jgi:hypothetical protein
MAGKVVLHSLTPMDFALADGSKIPAFDLKGDFVATKNSMEIEYIVAKGGATIPGLAEVLYINIGALHGRHGTKIFKIKGFSRTP